MQLAEKIEQIEQLNKELKALLPMSAEQKALLDKKFRLEFNYNSNHIEGNTLTYAETELLLIFDETRGSHPHRDYEEMKASDVALEMIEDLANDNSRPLTEAFIKDLNQILLVRPYWKDAITPDGQNTRRKILVGDYKKHPNSVLLANGEVFNYSSPSETPIQMSELIDWLRAEEDKGEFHPVELAALLHYRFVRIHPFDDGNGRISRLLMNYILLKHQYPPVVIKSEDKKNYLMALHDADVGNIDSFKRYIADQLIWSFELSITAAKNESIEEPEDWKKKLSLIKNKLSDSDTINVIKSDQVLVELINHKLFPFITESLSRLLEFDELFMDRGFKIYGSKNKTFIRQDAVLSADYIMANAREQLKMELIFEEFRKDVKNPFTIKIPLRVQFFKHLYEVYLNEEIVFAKLYHQDFTGRELNDLVNVVGRLVTSAIEKHIGT